MQTIGAALLAAERRSIVRLWTRGQDSRGAHGLLYLTAVSDDRREQEHCQASRLQRSASVCRIRMLLWSTFLVSLSPAVNKISTQPRYKDFDLRSITTSGLRPLIHASPPVFTRGSWEPWQQVNVQVRYSVTPYGRVDLLSPGHLAECPARTRAPQADPPGLDVGQIGQPWCVPQRLHKQMPQIGGCAITAQHVRCDGMRDENQLIFRNRSAWHERSTVAVLSAYEALCYSVASDHVRNLRMTLNH